jgi:inorganic pyrophosphatase/exopolyphosphatase
VPVIDLHFWDEFEASGAKVEQIALFDHNAIDPQQRDTLLNSGAKVTHILDHHADQNLYDTQVEMKQVRFIGSACSLLTFLLRDNEAKFSQDLGSDGVNLAYLLAAPVLLDSSNFHPDLKGNKWSDEDIDAFKWLQSKCQLPSSFYADLLAVKADQKVALSLTLRQNILRDYKNFQIGKGLLGAAVFVFPPAAAIETYPDFVSQVDAFCTENKLSIFCSLSNVESPEGFEKHLLVFKPNQH